MTLSHLLIILALAGATAFVLVTSRNAYRKRWQTILAATLRSLFGIAVIIAFLEPVFTVRRLPEHTGEIPVLIDASESMTRFDADSILAVFRNTLATITGSSSRPVRQPLYILFGDSVRSAPSGESFTAADRTSFFPRTGELPLRQSPQEMIIVSDANWSNPQTVTTGSEAVAVWYLPLRGTGSAATITCTLPDSIVTPVDTPAMVNIPCSGFARTAADIQLSISDNDIPVTADSQTIQAGPFHHTFALRLPGVKAGVYRYTVTAVNSTDTVGTTRFLLRHAVPRSFSYVIVASAPSLDNRFLRSALAGRTDFTETTAKTRRSADCRFIFSPSEASVASRSTLDVYLGRSPEASTGTTFPITDGNVTVNTTLHNPFMRLPVADLPPVRVTKPGKGITVTTAWITATADRDSFPLVFKGIYNNRSIIGCGFQEFWKWDFLPLAHTATGEADIFRFTRCCIDAAAATLRELRADTLLVYPAGQPSAHRPLRLSVVLPSIATPELKSVALSLKLRTADSTPILDTVVGIVATGSMLHEVRLPAVDTGRYTLSSTLSGISRGYASAITFPVQQEDAERRVTAQNEALLREMGQPFSPSDTALLTRLFTDAGSFQDREPSIEKLPVRRSWWLLALLLFSLGGEWLLRRVTKLD
ncbi:MAG: hypothetical protein JW863_09825 [Chitinispirillaceae bacterium]|nr:hypothetical protein [Chitinispirillaceae bacterium]